MSDASYIERGWVTAEQIDTATVEVTKFDDGAPCYPTLAGYLAATLESVARDLHSGRTTAETLTSIERTVGLGLAIYEAHRQLGREVSA